MSKKEKNSLSSLFRKEAIEAQGQRLYGDVIIIQPVAFKVLTILLSFVFLVTIIFMVFGSYSKKETVQGFLMPDKGISKIFVPHAGVVSEIFIKEGENVRAGDPLFSVTFEQSLVSGGGVETQLIQFLSDQINFTDDQIKEEETQADIRESQLKNDISALKQELVQMAERLNLQEQITADAKKSLEAVEGLADRGYVTQLDLTQRRSNYLNSQAGEASLKQQIEQTDNALKNKRSDLAALPSFVETSLSQLKSRKSELQQRLAQTEGQRAYTVTAPISGKISGMQIYLGLMTNPAMPLMSVLPANSKFHAELFVPTRAIGLIKPGQKVRIFYDAFRYQTFGTYQGTVSEISKTILVPSEISAPVRLEEPVYRVVSKLDTQEVKGLGETYPLQAGMTLEAVIVLEDQTFFEMIMEPLSALKGKM